MEERKELGRAIEFLAVKERLRQAEVSLNRVGISNSQMGLRRVGNMRLLLGLLRCLLENSIRPGLSIC